MKCINLLKTIIISVIFILLLCVEYGISATPATINYQGRLRQSGLPVTGLQTMRFKLYDALTDGTKIWDSGDVSNINVSTGIFSYKIGSQNAGGYNFSTIDWTAGPYYLETIVETTVMKPREQLVSSAYAFYASSAAYAARTKQDTINGLVKCSGSGTYSAIADNGTNWNNAYTEAVNNATHNNTANTIVKKDSNGNFSAGTITGNKIFQAGAALMPAGAVIQYSGAAAPAGWLMCDGSGVSRTEYADLFAVIGAIYGSGDGSTTFNLPDFRGSMPVGYNSGDSEFGALNSKGGSKAHSISVAEMPSHTHSIGTLTTDLKTPGITASQEAHAHLVGEIYSASSEASGFGLTYGTSYQNIAYVTGGSIGSTSVQPAITATQTAHAHAIAGNTGSAGSGTAMNILNPYITINFIIKY